MDEQARHGSPSAEIEVRRTPPPRELPPPTSIGGKPLVEQPSTAPRVGGTQPPPTGAIGHSPLIGAPVPSPSASSSMSPDFKSYVRDKTTLRFPCLLLGPDGRVSINPVLETGTLQNTTLQRQYGDVALVKVQLPPRKGASGDVAAMLKKPVEWQGKQYRLDLFDTGDADQAWGISTEDAARIAQVPADEWNEYARQGLFSEAVTGAAGRFQICLAPMGTSFAIKGGAALQVNDGFGFIRESVARTMGVTAQGVADKREIPSTQRGLDKPAHPNTQMLQWLKEDNAVVAELVNQAVNSLERQLGPRAQPPSGEDLYRAATTGDFKVRYGTAVPVPGKNVVLSIESTDGDPRVALHRSPADKPNWTQGAVEPSDSPLAKSIRELTAFQYRLQQKPARDRPMLMMKGLLGVIADDAWPEAYAGHQIVGCVTDCKVDTAWTSEAEVSSAKTAEVPRELALDGNLAVTQIFGPGSLVGVPAPMMKQLSGDYDGDAVHVLRASDCPMLFSRLGALDQRMNPKLTKHIVMHGEDEASAEHGPRSMATRLAEIRDADAIVGTWSTVADILCTIHPDQLETVRPRIAAITGLGLPDDAALWELVGLGIKVGTDLPKTNLSKLEFRGTRLEAGPLRKAGAAINRYLRSRGHDNPHARKHKDAIVDDLTSGRPMDGRAALGPAHYGVPGRIMRAVNEYLRIKWEQSIGFTGPLSPLFAPNEPTKRHAAKLLDDSRDADVRSADDIEAAARELIGKLVDLFDKETRTTARNRDADRWMLQALSCLRPSRMQPRYARLASLSGELAEAEAQKILGEVVDDLAHNFAQFVDSAVIRRGAVLQGIVVNEHTSGVFVDLLTGTGVNGLIRGATLGPRLAARLPVFVRVDRVRSTADKELVDLSLA